MAWITPLRRFAAAFASAFALLVLAGCGGSKSNGGGSTAPGTITVTVKVNYTRIPLLADANGVPTGLETNAANFKSLPSRGIRVRLWEGRDEVNPDGSKTRIWVNTQSGGTDSTGSVEFSGAAKDTDAFVEVLSYFPIVGGGDIRVVGNPDGIDSTLPVGERVLYALRKGLDGASPAGNPVPGAKSAANTTVTFNVGTEDKWWLTLASFNQIANAVQEVDGSGSRVLAILDTIYALSTSGLGFVSPGNALDIHYRRGVTHPRGAFIEYDRSRYPQSFDSGTQSYHYFGTLKGGPADDDAYDEGVILPLMARNGVWALGIGFQHITAKALPDFMPDNALVEAFPFIQAATLLKSPYLADTYAGGSHNTDIRALGSNLSGPRSAPAIAGLGWDILLKANSLPNPGTPTDWAKINVLTMLKLFGLTIPADLSDRPNVYLQLARLKEAKSSTDPVDLAAIFTDPVLTAMAAPYNITWPRPTTGPDAGYITDWSKDPNSLATPLPAMAFSMSKAVQVEGVYPNSSSGEAAYAKFSLSKDTVYNLHVTTTPAVLPAGTRLEVRLLTPLTVWEFDGTATPSTRIVLKGNKDTAINYLVRVAILSPGTLAPDISATVSLDLAN